MSKIHPANKQQGTQSAHIRPAEVMLEVRGALLISHKSLASRQKALHATSFQRSSAGACKMYMTTY